MCLWSRWRHACCFFFFFFNVSVLTCLYRQRSILSIFGGTRGLRTCSRHSMRWRCWRPLLACKGERFESRWTSLPSCTGLWTNLLTVSPSSFPTFLFLVNFDEIRPARESMRFSSESSIAEDSNRMVLRTSSISLRRWWAPCWKTAANWQTIRLWEWWLLFLLVSFIWLCEVFFNENVTFPFSSGCENCFFLLCSHATFSAGQHTSNVTGTWLGLNLLQNPKDYKRCVEELQKNIGGPDEPASLQSLKGTLWFLFYCICFFDFFLCSVHDFLSVFVFDGFLGMCLFGTMCERESETSSPDHHFDEKSDWRHKVQRVRYSSRHSRGH